MDPNLLLGALSGFIGAVVLTFLIYLLQMAGYKMDIPYLLGTLFVDSHRTTAVYLAGVSLHLFAGVLWGVLYIILLAGASITPNWPAGILWGFAHGIIVGVLIGNLTQNHPYIGENKPIADPGIMGSRWGTLIPYWILGIHVVYGVVTLSVYHYMAY